MTIRVFVNGAHGKMGQLTVKTLNEHSQFNVVGEGVRGQDLAAAIKDSKANVVIDFTNADVVLQNTLTILETGTHAVIGTSGFLKKNVQQVADMCERLKIGAIIAPNFSLGAVLMIKAAQEIVKYLPNVEVIEMHHPDKADSPSGTAARTAEILAESRLELPISNPKARDVLPGARGANYQNVPIHAVRLPGYMAHQQILFGSTGESLTIRHDSIDRECFMPGVILACEKVMGLNKLVYGLENIL